MKQVDLSAGDVTFVHMCGSL